MPSSRNLVAGVAALAVIASVAACSSPASNDGAGQSTTQTTATTSVADAHNQADAMFAQQMIPHHRQAVEMSDMIMGKQGIDPRVMDLATQIKAAQAPEIQQMQTWLSQWGMPTMPGGGNMPGGGGMPGMDDMHGMGDMPGMDGMMSDEEMGALQNAQGVAASKLFLAQMIAHHQGAITMAQNEIKSGQYPAATAMARSIVTSQQQEIDTMKKVLASL
ncbi:DUF305 domain-containing protein [Mycolicibacterium hodleri]|uniref:DUF305 domain-containing protein n=1 Tax=Mycolicibacterium hodleri TaxID=49897 RepID=A0A502EKY5_9MYCO|nr:DUF305 domain-containing protein [Mycolicibacterium hodleri]TPG37146.1 DUF305 domain-containing protein [Mycolicibacterium hodleri]